MYTVTVNNSITRLKLKPIRPYRVMYYETKVNIFSYLATRIVNVSRTKK